MSGAVVMQTPYNMPTATTSVGRINHQAELRLQRTVTQLEIKQRQAVVKMNRKIHEVVEELYNIRKGIEPEQEREKTELEPQNQSTENEREPEDNDEPGEHGEKVQGSESEALVATENPRLSNSALKKHGQKQNVHSSKILSAGKTVKTSDSVGTSSVKGVSWTGGKAKHSEKKAQKSKLFRIKDS